MHFRTEETPRYINLAEVLEEISVNPSPPHDFTSKDNSQVPTKGL